MGSSLAFGEPPSSTERRILSSSRSQRTRIASLASAYVELRERSLSGSTNPVPIWAPLWVNHPEIAHPTDRVRECQSAPTWNTLDIWCAMVLGGATVTVLDEKHRAT